LEKKRAKLCIGIIFALNTLCILPTAIFGGSADGTDANIIFVVTSVIFMWFPTIATIITKKITKDSFKVGVRPNIRKNIKYYMQALLFPGVFVCIGAIIYFALFPHTPDWTLGYARSLIGDEIALPSSLTIPWVFLLAMGATLIAPLIFVNHIFAFGEEYGWRGYILPKLQSFMSNRKAATVSGVLWGLGHAPLICFGLQYGFGYPGFPYTGILMMTVFATVIGIWFSYLTMQTKSVIAASIAHGAINTIRGGPAFFAVVNTNMLLGPNPSGIIGMTGLIILALACFYKMKNSRR